jgi:hypothetical protein
MVLNNSNETNSQDGRSRPAARETLVCINSTSDLTHCGIHESVSKELYVDPDYRNNLCKHVLTRVADYPDLLNRFSVFKMPVRGNAAQIHVNDAFVMI